MKTLRGQGSKQIFWLGIYARNYLSLWDPGPVECAAKQFSLNDGDDALMAK